MDIEDVIAQIREVAQGSGSIALLNDEVVVLMSWIENTRAENAELRARLDKLETQNICHKIGIDLGYLEELADRLDAHAQHPGFPQPPARVTNPDEPNGTCPTCGTIFGDGDLDEPVAGTG